MTVPFVDLASQQAEVDAEVRRGLDEVFATTAFIGGPHVTEFERRYAAFCGVAHCVGVANGTDALELVLRALDVPAGGEVVLPANSFIATAEAVARMGGSPVLVDVDDEHLLMDPDLVASAVTARTAAVVPVHLFGQMAPVEQVLARRGTAGWALVEDAAQSQGATRDGATSGSVGLAAATSFYPGKNLGAAGDAGAVTTGDAALARAVRTIAAHGSATKYVHERLGLNSRLDTVQAVVLLAKLKRLHVWNEARRAAARRYEIMLSDVDGVRLPTVMPGNEHVWHIYGVRVARRDEVMRAVQEAGIGVGIHYPQPIHLTPAFDDLELGPGSFPVAERAATELLSLPMFPHITVAQQEAVVAALRSAIDRVVPVHTRPAGAGAASSRA